jgi:hypothetical protein
MGDHKAFMSISDLWRYSEGPILQACLFSNNIDAPLLCHDPDLSAVIAHEVLTYLLPGIYNQLPLST